MGTRGAMGFRVDGVDKITYNHFDSYPEGLGDTIVSWLRGADICELKPLVRGLTLVDANSRPTTQQMRDLEKYSDTSVGERSTDDWYCLLRDTQGDPAATLEAGYMVDFHKFMADSLWCEWAYIVNFDEGTFEVYRGFQNHKHASGRYADMPTEDGKYFPVALVKTFPIDDIPSDWISKVCPDEEACA